jgi:hypothetical protein
MTDDDQLAFILTVSTNKVGSKCDITVEIDRESWESMSADEREKFMLDELFGSGMVEWNYEELK